jgi:cytochrome P450
MVFRDPPDHTRLRRHVATTLNNKVFASLEKHVVSVIDHQLDAIEAGRDFEFVSAFAHPMPGYVVMDILGVPRDKLLETKRFANEMMLFIGGARNVDNKYERARHGAVATAKLFQETLDRRRSQPAGDDVLGQLMTSDINGQRMTDDELIGTMMMLLNAAHDTTANAISNALMLLAARPDLAAELRAHPEKLSTATDEFLRYDSPVLSVGRVASKDTRLGDKEIAQGNRVYVMLVAVNRDPAIFEDPDIVDIDRSPNPHMAFGKGQHFCLGAPLARMEVKLSMSRILERFSRLELRTPPDAMEFHNSLVARGPVRFDFQLS